MAELKGSEKQIKYAKDILEETFRVIPQYSKWLDKEIKDTENNNEVTIRMYAIDKAQLNILIEWLKNEDRANIIISSLKDILYNDDNKNGLEYGKWKIINQSASHHKFPTNEEIQKILEVAKWQK